jgi:hypothetical protein
MTFGGIVVLLAASAIVVASLVKWAGEARVPTRDVAQPPPMAPASPAVVPPSEPLPPSEPSPREPEFATDAKGFVNTSARCDEAQTAVALGRTERSYVVICGGANGHYEYLGVRLSDDAILKTAAETTPSRGFLARNAGVVYAVSPTELLVTAGDSVIKQEPMIEFYGSTLR